MLTPSDLAVLKERGISQETLNEQLKRFQTGFPHLRLAGAASPGNGILVLSDQERQAAVERWNKFLVNGDVCKFVPASGAASRMFKALFSFVNGTENEPAADSPVAEIIANIHKMPFYSQLDEVLKANKGKTADELIDAGQYKDVIAGIINPEGLNYGNLPKGLLSFHRYADGTVRTPLEEQLVEGAQTAAANGKVKVHFTVSANHMDLFKRKLAEVLPGLESRTGLKFDVSMSVQKPSTDTVAANPDNTLFRDDNGNLVFRPGGHGALISNLGDIDATVVFIKNIDNVVPDSRRSDTVLYKQVLGGVLLTVKDTIAVYTKLINEGNATDVDYAEMIKFVRNTLCIKADGLESMSKENLGKWMLSKFNRPVRVCGMVRNEGEPGGGPYIAYNADGTASPQILESTQIDMGNSENVSMMQNATHFNPVDLVCLLRDLEGKPFNLSEHVDQNTGFISSKSFAGRELKALELPGLWNGAMSDWNTVFVEVPVSTFNPVKTVNDLLRPVHQEA